MAAPSSSSAPALSVAEITSEDDGSLPAILWVPLVFLCLACVLFICYRRGFPALSLPGSLRVPTGWSQPTDVEAQPLRRGGAGYQRLRQDPGSDSDSDGSASDAGDEVLPPAAQAAPDGTPQKARKLLGFDARPPKRATSSTGGKLFKALGARHSPSVGGRKTGGIRLEGDSVPPSVVPEVRVDPPDLDHEAGRDRMAREREDDDTNIVILVPPKQGVPRRKRSAVSLRSAAGTTPDPAPPAPVLGEAKGLERKRSDDSLDGLSSEPTERDARELSPSFAAPPPAVAV